MRRRVDANLATHPWLVAESAEGFLGYAYAAPHRARAAYRWSTEVSVYLADAARRCGAGRALYVALLAILEAQGFHRALAGIALPNPASAAFHEALGFTLLGTFEAVGYKQGVWCDVGWWQRPLSDTPGASPPAPPPFAEWRASADRRRTLGSLGVGS
jgi:phosphinothricin acetyltransferase